MSKKLIKAFARPANTYRSGDYSKRFMMINLIGNNQYWFILKLKQTEVHIHPE